MATKVQDLILINITTVLLGCSGLFAQLIPLPAPVIICGRLIIAGVCLMLPLLFMKSVTWITAKADLNKIMIAGILIALSWILFYAAIQMSSVSIGIISLYTYPCFSSIIEPFWYRQPIKKRHIFAALAVILGVFILSSHHIEGGDVMWGLVLGVASAILFTIRNLIVKPLTLAYSSQVLMGYQCVIGAFFCLPFFAKPLLLITGNTLALLLLSGIVFTALSHTLFVKSMERLSVTTVGIIASFQIIYAVILGIVFLGEEISKAVFLGGGIVLIAVVIENIFVSQEKNKAN
ncbi:hypothetical protein DID78_01655 [Candidatus Marinamargulisbacteria bacterium SCGC AG-343-D04]|nr:hypothetical protein DID78_01655 [Candidatus Marinamargulisbacteria bacterium SCGC AG-343-D04]